MATIIDDFEDQDLAEYNAGDTSQFAVNNSLVQNGSYGVEYQGGNNWHHILSTQGDGSADLNYYPTAGDTITMYAHFDGVTNGDIVFVYAAQSTTWTPNCYALRLSPRNSEFDLEKDFSSDLGSTAVTYPTNEWLRAVFDWGSSGSLTATLYDSSDTQLGQVSATDSTYSGGGVGIECRDYDGNTTGPHADYIYEGTVDTGTSQGTGRREQTSSVESEGAVLTDSNDTRWRVTVDHEGRLTVTQL